MKEWEIGVIVVRWGWLDELPESFARAGQKMKWKDKPQVLLGRRMDGKGKDHWCFPIVNELGDEGERDAAAYGLMNMVGLPLNPQRFTEVNSTEG